MQEHGHGTPTHDGSALGPGTELDGRYIIERRIASGGFGITYAARHRTLDRVVAIKEHFPRQLAARDPTSERVQPTNPSVYQWALDRFLQEGRSLARCKHPNIVDVADVFEANGTAYMVLAYEEGSSLARWLERLGRPPTQAELDAIVAPLLDALETVHEKGMLHRDIAPDNIIIRRGGAPCLIDFGAARAAIANQSHAISAIVKSGYSPPEQYTTTGRAQGAWSDIYALAATLWRCVTGRRPVEATDRMIGDRLGSVHDAATDRNAWRRSFLDGIDRALSLKQAERPQSVGDWRKMLLAGPQTGAARQAASRQPDAPQRQTAPVGGDAGREPPDAPATRPGGEPASFGLLPAAFRAGTGRAARWPVAAIVGIAIMAAALATLGASWQRSGDGPRPLAAPSATAPAPIPASVQPPQPAAATVDPGPAAPQLPTGRSCDSLEIARCNSAPGCEWRVLVNACVASTAGEAAASTSRPDCAGLRSITTCNAERHCAWSVITDTCRRIDVAPPTSPSAQSPAAAATQPDCSTFRTIARCNAERSCTWSVIRETCRRIDAPAPAATAPQPPTPVGCGSLDIVRCNSAPGCEWRINDSACIASPSEASQPAGQTASRCAQLRSRTACNAVERCFWSGSRSTCIGPDSPSGSTQPAVQTVGRCAQFHTRTACNAVERCFWSDSRGTCIGPDR